MIVSLSEAIILRWNDPTITVLVLAVLAFFLYGSRIPIARMRLELSGTGFADVHVKVGDRLSAVAS